MNINDFYKHKEYYNELKEVSSYSEYQKGIILECHEIRAIYETVSKNKFFTKEEFNNFLTYEADICQYRLAESERYPILSKQFKKARLNKIYNDGIDYATEAKKLVATIPSSQKIDANSYLRELADSLKGDTYYINCEKCHQYTSFLATLEHYVEEYENVQERIDLEIWNNTISTLRSHQLGKNQRYINGETTIKLLILLTDEDEDIIFDYIEKVTISQGTNKVFSKMEGTIRKVLHLLKSLSTTPIENIAFEPSEQMWKSMEENINILAQTIPLTSNEKKVLAGLMSLPTPKKYLSCDTVLTVSHPYSVPRNLFIEGHESPYKEWLGPIKEEFKSDPIKLEKLITFISHYCISPNTEVLDSLVFYLSGRNKPHKLVKILWKEENAKGGHVPYDLFYLYKTMAVTANYQKLREFIDVPDDPQYQQRSGSIAAKPSPALDVFLHTTFGINLNHKSIKEK